MENTPLSNEAKQALTDSVEQQSASDLTEGDKDKSDGAPLTTWHTAQLGIQNKTDSDFAFVVVSHASGSGNPRDIMCWTNVAANSTTSETLTINFQTGFGSGNDYWYIVFEWSNQALASQLLSKSCNFTSDDKDGTGYIRMEGDIWQFAKVTIVPPVSSNCDCGVGQVPNT